MIRMGLTGGVATGKSTVVKMMTDRGALLIDADVLAREVVQKDQPAYHDIIQTFGSAILNEYKEIDRAKLGEKVFHNPRQREQLNEIVHPHVRRLIASGVESFAAQEQATGKNFLVLLDIPLLFESNLSHWVDLTVVVYCPEDIQLKRLMARNHLTEDEALARIHSQTSIEEKVKLADEVIDNGQTLAYTQEQVNLLLNQFEWNQAE